MAGTADEKAAVAEVILKYSSAASDRDADRMMSCFTPDGQNDGIAVLIGLEDRPIGVEEFRKAISENWTTLEWLQQLPHIVELSVEGDSHSGGVGRVSPRRRGFALN